MNQISENKEIATLSKMLRVTMSDEHAFVVAVERGLIKVADDGNHLKWTLGSKVLLAYFCGKMWAGDRGVYSVRKKRKVWRNGDMLFPGKELDRIFGLDSLKQMRHNRKNMPLPNYHYLVDNLFDSDCE